MKLKLVVASMGILGFISQAAFADISYKDNYKDKVACIISKNTIIMNDMTQNTGRSLPNPCYPGWFNRIHLSGGVNFDTGKWGNRDVGNPAAVGGTGRSYNGENTRKFTLNDAYLNMSVDINDWASAFMGISYIDASPLYSMAYQTAVNSLFIDNINNRPNVQQAYLRIGNFEESPFYVELGQEFQDYGRYEIHPITESLPQVLTETLRTSLKIGFLLPMGINGSASIFQNPLATSINGVSPYNYVGSLGFSHPNDDFGYQIGIGYMYNMFGINSIGNMSAYKAGIQFPAAIYHQRVDGIALYGDVNFTSFALNLRYTNSMRDFSPLDFPLAANNLAVGAKPWAASALASYGFNLFAINQNVYAGYQVSRQTVFFNLPRDRWQIGYGINLLKHTDLTAEWDHDLAYSVAQGGPTQGASNLVSLRLAITFG
jgi:hypothetical protein